MSLGRRSGFTLIEVMIAVVILAVGLSSLFTSEAGAVKIAQRARSTTVATLLARCKMGEVEEKVAKEGWPGDVIEGRDECCDGAPQEGFTCEWKVERIKLPEVDVEDGNPLSQEGKDKAKQAALTGGGSSAAPLPTTGAAALPGDGGAVAGLGGPGGTISSLEGDAGIAGLITSTGSESAGSDPMASLVMEMTLPMMKPIIEEGVRRATVIVTWKEASREHSFDLVQYLVNEAPMLPEENAVDNALQGQPGAATGGAAGGTGGAAGGGAAGAGAVGGGAGGTGGSR